MEIEIVYFEGCPSHEQLLEQLPCLLESSQPRPVSSFAHATKASTT